VQPLEQDQVIVTCESWVDSGHTDPGTRGAVSSKTGVREHCGGP